MVKFKIISNKTNDILSATKLILPGVGSFDTDMINIKKKGILNSIEKKVREDIYTYSYYLFGYANDAQ